MARRVRRVGGNLLRCVGGHRHGVGVQGRGVVVPLAGELGLDKRFEALESEGIVAEVVFPNTTPPFFPNGLLAAPGPRRSDGTSGGGRVSGRTTVAQGLLRRRAGSALRCGAAVHRRRGRRRGGIRSAKDPASRRCCCHRITTRSYTTSTDGAWTRSGRCARSSTCRSGGTARPSVHRRPASVAAAHACGVYETLYFGHRTLFQVVLSGVFERFPGLKMVFTELGAGPRPSTRRRASTGSVPRRASRTIARCSPAKRRPAGDTRERGRPAELLLRFAAPGARRRAPLRDRYRPDDVGADFPHHAGTVPYTLQVFRDLERRSRRQRRELLGGTAAALYGADLESLQAIADEVGFTPAQVAAPLTPDEIPDDPNFRPYLGARPLSADRGVAQRPSPWPTVGRCRVSNGCPRADSNCRARLRRPMLCPLSYEGGGSKITSSKPRGPARLAGSCEREPGSGPMSECSRGVNADTPSARPRSPCRQNGG